MESFTFVALLKACAKRKDLCKGTRLHAEILKKGLLEKSHYLTSTLINMYAKCGALAKAEQILKDVTVRDAVCWSALIAGYAQQGQGHEALSSFDWMLNEGLSPDAITFTSVLKACGQIRAIDKGKQIHEEVVRRRMLEKDIVLGTALIDMYAKCGMIRKAQQVLEELPVRNVVTWSVLIAGCVQHGHNHEALDHFEQMQSEGLSPDVVTFICILKACGNTGAIDKGKEIHDEVVSRCLLNKDVVLGTSLVDMYAKCGFLLKAKQVLEELPVQNFISWSALIAGYVQQGQGQEALNCFEEMQKKGFSPDMITFISVLKACGNTGALEKGKQVHEDIVKKGFLHKDMMIDNALVDMYARCGMLEKAKQFLEELPARDVVTWNSLMTGYVQQGQGHEVFDCFERMQRDGIAPDAVSFICILKACTSDKAIDKGKQVHEEIVRRGFLENDSAIGSALVDMYAKCGMLEKAQEVLEGLPVRTVISWSALISGYAEQERCHEALNCLERMQSEGLSPNAVTFICVLKACSKTGVVVEGERIHNEILGTGLLDKDVVLGNALVDMYAKCGALAKARQVLDALPVRDVVSWNALMAVYAQTDCCHEALNCYEQMQREGLIPDGVTFICILKTCGNVWAVEKGFTQQGQALEALNCFEQMQNEGLSADAVTFICVLKACGSMGALDTGKQIHEEILRKRMLKNDTILSTALVDMYAKCGELDTAHEALEELPVRNVVSWSALIAGYAQQGHSHEALNCFQQMRCEGHSPNEVTLLCVLIACCHSGLLNEAQIIFRDMVEKYGISPTADHHACMILIFGGSGQFDEAMSLIKVMPTSDYPALWLALLSACRKWGNVKLGRLAFDQAVQLDSGSSAAYVLMANIFATAGMQEDAESVDAMRLKYATSEDQGKCMWVNTSGIVVSWE